jgi:hypothetical protein
MFTSIFDSLFGCTHQKTTFPITPKRRGRAYVACLDCGKEFDYDWKNMRMGEELRGVVGRVGGTVSVHH